MSNLIPAKARPLNEQFAWTQKSLNRSIVWGGYPALGFWYYCAKCSKGESKSAARLAIGDKFCGNCGGKLTWPK